MLLSLSDFMGNPIKPSHGFVSPNFLVKQNHIAARDKEKEHMRLVGR